MEIVIQGQGMPQLGDVVWRHGVEKHQGSGMEGMGTAQIGDIGHQDTETWGSGI